MNTFEKGMKDNFADGETLTRAFNCNYSYIEIVITWYYSVVKIDEYAIDLCVVCA